MIKCEFCQERLPEGKKETARFCSGKCKQAAYRQRVKERTPYHWQPGEQAIAHDGFIVTIGEMNEDRVMVQVRYTLTRVPDDKASIWRPVPQNRLKRLEALRS